MSVEHPCAVVGAQTGVAFPTSLDNLLDQGAEFLTRALRATGAIGADNAVTAIAASSEFFGGGMGRKLWLTVSYARDEPGLDKDLFVKFPREFGDPLRDLFGPLMEPEVRFALLSMQPDFPVQVPKCYFADYDPATISGLLITARIPYGSDGIESCPEKCRDYQLADPLPYYQALTLDMARLAGAHKAGRLGDDLPSRFPFDPDVIDPGSRIPFTPELLQQKLETLRAFVAGMPQMFPDGLAETVETFIAEVPMVLDLELGIRRFLNSRADMIALCHWNMNLDNAWFSRAEDGALSAGLLDWGSVGQMNVAQAFFGMTCAAEPDFLIAHRRTLIDLFVAEFAASGGPLIDADEMALMVKLSMAVLGVAWMLDAPSLVAQELPDYAKIKDRFDPRLTGNFLAHAQAHLLRVLMSEWHHDDIGGALRAFQNKGVV
ncbi:MAG: hypothetical protein RL367_2504 [Pseudomonadota bacterium]